MNTFGHSLKLSIFGESHGHTIGITLDGCPAGLKIEKDEFNTDLARRKSGKIGTTPRKELDRPEIISGIYKSYTTGAPITFIFRNKDTKSKDYETFKRIPRPGHADFTAYKKYNGFNDPRGGGHFSGRLTLGLVAAGVIAKKLIFPLFVNAELIEAGGDQNIERAIQKALKDNDSIGGIIECKSENVPVGLGEPFFNKIEAVISHLVMSIPAVKGIEFGSGFQSAQMKGSEHNDPIIDKIGRTETNHAGGINGGITNGNDLIFRVPVKPTSSTPKKQKTINLEKEKIEELEIKGRHDACIALRVPVIIEAVTAFALADFMLQEQRIPRFYES
ncbi:MAG: chorismate synthase [Bacteroidota bacterium]